MNDIKLYFPIERCAKLRKASKRRGHDTKKQWTGREKLAIWLEEVKGDYRISELGNEHGSRKECTTNGRINCLRMEPNYLSGAKFDHARERLELKKRRLKETFGKLIIELKKNDL